MLRSRKRTSPSTRTPATRSFMRLMQRSSVLLPQPDGPISAVMRRSGTANVTSESARDAPYHSDSASMRTTGFSSSAPPKPSISMPVVRLHPRGRVPAPQAVAQEDGAEVRGHDHGDQEQRGREYQRLDGLDIGALEAHVVDVEAQVHELPLQVREGELAVERQAGRE